MQNGHMIGIPIDLSWMAFILNKSRFKKKSWKIYRYFTVFLPLGFLFNVLRTVFFVKKNKNKTKQKYKNVGVVLCTS